MLTASLSTKDEQKRRLKTESVQTMGRPGAAAMKTETAANVAGDEWVLSGDLIFEGAGLRY